MDMHGICIVNARASHVPGIVSCSRQHDHSRVLVAAQAGVLQRMRAGVYRIACTTAASATLCSLRDLPGLRMQCDCSRVASLKVDARCGSGAGFLTQNPAPHTWMRSQPTALRSRWRFGSYPSLTADLRLTLNPAPDLDAVPADGVEVQVALGVQPGVLPEQVGELDQPLVQLHRLRLLRRLRRQRRLRCMSFR